MKQMLRHARRYCRAKILGLPGSTPTPKKWLFVVGCYNSGTTLLKQLLSRHEDIAAMATEGQFYTDELATPQYLGLARAWALKPELFAMEQGQDYGVDINRLKRQWVRAAGLSKQPILMEKSPTNAARITWLNENFPNSYFLAITRNGYAVVEGMHRKAGLDIESATRQWQVSNQIMNAGLGRVPRKLAITYEMLTESSEETLRMICEFLDLEPKALVNQTETLNIHGERSSLRNMNADSIRRLSSEDVDTINRIASDQILSSGYQLIGFERMHS